MFVSKDKVGLSHLGYGLECPTDRPKHKQLHSQQIEGFTHKLGGDESIEDKIYDR